MKYKTLFINAPIVKKKAAFGINVEQVNGDQLCRDVNAAIMEMVEQGFELAESAAINSSAMVATGHVSSPTSGVMLIFKKND